MFCLKSDTNLNRLTFRKSKSGWNKPTELRRDLLDNNIIVLNSKWLWTLTHQLNAEILSVSWILNMSNLITFIKPQNIWLQFCFIPRSVQNSSRYWRLLPNFRRTCLINQSIWLWSFSPMYKAIYAVYAWDCILKNSSSKNDWMHFKTVILF